MRNKQNWPGQNTLMPALLVVLLLSACGSGNANATPTVGVDAIFTAAFQTLEAQQATQIALTPPTSTVTVTPFPSLPPPSPIVTSSFASSTPSLGGGGTVCDNSAYVSDVTIPDGTTLKPGEKFTKTWRIYNSGSCAWSTSYKLAFVSGEALGGATTVLAAAVPSGQQVDISVAMTAPTTNGTFRGDWRMQNASGVGFGNVIYVEIKVGAGSTVTPGPSPTGGPTSSTTYKISGSAGVGSGVTVTCIGKNLNKPTVQATVDNNGNYFCNVPLHWAGSIEPFKQGWTFSPQKIEGIDDVTADLPNQNFTATQ